MIVHKWMLRIRLYGFFREKWVREREEERRQHGVKKEMEECHQLENVKLSSSCSVSCFIPGQRQSITVRTNIFVLDQQQVLCCASQTSLTKQPTHNNMLLSSH